MERHQAEAPFQAITNRNMQGQVWKRRGKEENSLIERSEPSVALMMIGTTEGSLPEGDGKPLRVSSFSELFNEVIREVPVDWEPSSAVGVSPEEGVMLKLTESAYRSTLQD
jgi:hypothetical protein